MWLSSCSCFCCEMCKTGSTCQRGQNFSGVWCCLRCRAVILLRFLHLFPMDRSDCWASCSWCSARLLFPPFSWVQSLCTDGGCSLLWLSLTSWCCRDQQHCPSIQPPFPHIGTGQIPLSSGAHTGCLHALWIVQEHLYTFHCWRSAGNKNAFLIFSAVILPVAF